MRQSFQRSRFREHGAAADQCLANRRVPSRPIDSRRRTGLAPELHQTRAKALEHLPLLHSRPDPGHGA